MHKLSTCEQRHQVWDGILGIETHTSQFPQQMVIYDSPNYPCLMMVYSRNVNERTIVKERQKWTDLHMAKQNTWHILQYSSAHQRHPGLGKLGKEVRREPDHLFLLWAAVWRMGETKMLHFSPGRVAGTDEPGSGPPDTATSRANLIFKWQCILLFHTFVLPL